jgi:hypothetical protein
VSRIDSKDLVSKLIHAQSFYYADQRNEKGGNMGTAVDGEAHAEWYYELASGDGSVPWDATFTKGKGYVDYNHK